MHDAQAGKITSIRFDKDEKFIVSTAEDGLIYIHLIDKENILKEASFQPLEGIEGIDYMAESQKEEIKADKMQEFFDQNPPYFAEVNYETDGLDLAYLASSVKLTEDVNEDIIDPT